MSEKEKDSIVETEKSLNNDTSDTPEKKKPFKKKRLIITLSILTGISVIVAVGLPIALSKLFPSVNMSFLKNYQAQIDDAESLGISLENKAPSFVKQKVDDHEIVDVPFVKKGQKSSTNKRSALKNAAEGYFKNADGVLNRYLVYEDYTFVEYVAKKSEMIQQEDGGPYYYYPAYYRTFSAYDSWLGEQLAVQYREDQYINSYSIDETGVAEFDKKTNFAWNKTHQSFVIDNHTGYIYPLDFLKIGESISVVNGALSLNIPKSDDYWQVNHHLVEFNIENDNLVITNVIKNEGLRYGIVCKDKYGQYYIVADIMNDQVDYEKKIYAFNKGHGAIYEYGTGVDNIDINFNRVEREVVIFEDDVLKVLGDGFTKIQKDEYHFKYSNGETIYKMEENGTYSIESYSISYPFDSYDANRFHYSLIKQEEVENEGMVDKRFEFSFYSCKFINDFENDEVVIIAGDAVYSIKIGALINYYKEGSDSDVLLSDGTLIFEGIDSYAYIKENYWINYCILEVKVSNLSGTQVYVLTLDENGNYIFVEKESYVAKDITITISPINKD